MPLLLFSLMGFSSAAASLAHELGTIRTSATFRKDGTYRIELTIDREHLPPGFASAPLAGPARVIESVSPAVESWVGPILERAVAGTRIAFDGREVAPRIEVVPPAGVPSGQADSALAAAAEITLVLTGPIPPGSKTFTWSNAVRLGSYMLAIRSEEDANVVRQWLENGEECRPLRLHAAIVPPTRGQVIWTYLALGYTHILPKGADHILFVLGIFLLSTRWKPVLLQVTAFTVAHTITLALTIYGLVSLSRSVVEPLIALSIVYVAVENLATSELKPWRIALVFGFGLLHGMGFAGVLSELGLPRSEFLTALLTFNLGVEAGQLTVIGLAFLLVGLPFRRKAWYRSRVVIPVSVAVASVGLYWAIERVFKA